MEKLSLSPLYTYVLFINRSSGNAKID